MAGDPVSSKSRSLPTVGHRRSEQLPTNTVFVGNTVLLIVSWVEEEYAMVLGTIHRKESE